MGDFSIDYAVQTLLRRRALLECHVQAAERDLMFAVSEAGDDWSELFRRERPKSFRMRRQLDSLKP